uniref:Trafficking protein particle complex subunit 4 n=1 Tax=Rhizophora mucronata TaxID=61149 RepID=A0A2P2JRG3_RHIMU
MKSNITTAELILLGDSSPQQSNAILLYSLTQIDVEEFTSYRHLHLIKGVL